MEFKRASHCPGNTVTRDVEKLDKVTGNTYESVMVIAKRANQISVTMKQELSKKLEEFTSFSESIEEVFENREQIEMSKHYEQLPKSTLQAIQEFQEGKIYFRKAETK
ncbi:MAG: DNA-directed RNA polymerase subunit omega [Prevotellaceae bacterium]|jgi:DNA-directed RNA polymerase subunit K/omega|nr:DNA-directed RNA polymerase subunit omega [Prevotellaceae bacterium]